MVLRRAIWIVLIGLLLCSNAYARVLLVTSQETELYQSFQRGFEAGLAPLPQKPALVSLLAGAKVGEAEPGSYDVIIAAGVEAAKVLAGIGVGDVPVIYTMLPYSSYVWLRDNGMLAKQHKVLYIDQPPSRFVNLFKTALPEVKSFGYIYGEVSSAHLDDLRASVKAKQLELHEIMLTGDVKLIDALDYELVGSDAVLVLPDPYLFNRRAVQSLLLASFRQRKPLITYSESFVNAGALLGLYSTSEQIGRQTAEILACMQQPGCAAGAAAKFYPRYFSISVNGAVARQLGLNVRPAEELQQLLEALEAKNPK